MYRIETPPVGQGPRLIASEVLSPADFRALATLLGTPAVRARKRGLIRARRAERREHVETRWNGKESEAYAEPGDWVVTALAADGMPLTDASGSRNVYVVQAARFGDLYEVAQGSDAHATSEGLVFRPKGVVEALRFPGGFEIKAPWGEVQRAADGWLLLNGPDVYGNHRDTFAATYETIA